MNFAEIVGEVRQLSGEEQLSLVEIILANVRKNEVVGLDEGIPSILEMEGILKPDGKMPTDEELKEDYYNYLERKYLK